MITRKAHTLVEALVVIGILAALVGLLLPAIQKVRSSAAGLQDKCSMRQVALATHNFASAHGGRLPSATEFTGFFDSKAFVLAAILPHLGVAEPYSSWDTQGRGRMNVKVPVYLSPLDPTLAGQESYRLEASGVSCFVVNATALGGWPSMTASFPDGTVNTIFLTERYYACTFRTNYSFYPGMSKRDPKPPSTVDRFAGDRSASFAYA